MAAETNASGPPGPVIDKLLDFFVANDGTAYYQVKWKPTWERADALLQFTDLIDTFWKFVNNAHTGNLYNNQSMHKGPDPILPLPPPPQINVQTTPKSVPITPKQKMKNSVQNLQQKSNTITTPQRKHQPTPTKTPTKPTIVQAVVIDSDDEDIAEVATSSMASSLQNMPGNNTITSMPMQQQQQQQQQYSMNPMWNVQPKSEPSDIPDQKPFQGNQQNFDMNNFNQQQQQQQQQQQHPPQQQFQFPMQNVNPSPNGRGRGRGRGRGGRGGADTTGTKRKSTQPISGASSNKVANPVKMETPDDMTSTPHMFNLGDSSPSNDNFGGYDLSDSSPSNDNIGGKWEDNFEIIEKKNFDGTSLETQYKCTICNTIISNKGSCRRHYNIHSGQKSHKCPICDKGFHRLDYMQRHLKIHGQGGGKELEGLIKLAMESVKK